MQRIRKDGAGLLVLLGAIVALGTAACSSGCSANEQIAKHAHTAQGQLGRVAVLIDQCAQGSDDPGSCTEAKGGVSAIGQSLSDIEKAAQ